MKHIMFMALAICSLLSSCKKDGADEKSYNVEGFAQKGPFLAGANVTIIELDSKLNPTGRTFESTVEDNTGKFTFPNVKFASQYVQVKVTGMAYDEVIGGIPMEQLTLVATADLSTTSKINVNIVTHLVSPRTKILVESGLSFQEAKDKAEKELLKAFYLDKHASNNSESMSLTNNDTDAGILLMISSIIQAKCGTTAPFPEYVTNLQTDFKNKGEFTSDVSRKILMTGARVIDIVQINENLSERYSAAGINYTPNNFSVLLDEFIDNSNYPSYMDGIIPSESNNSINLIAGDDTVYIDKSAKYSITLNCPANNMFSYILLNISSKDNTFSTTNDFSINVNDTSSRVCFKDMKNGVNMDVPVTFSGTGQLKITTNYSSSLGS